MNFNTSGIIETVRRDELKQILANAGLSVSFPVAGFNSNRDSVASLEFEVGSIQITAFAISNANYDWDLVPVDTVLFVIDISPENSVLTDMPLDASDIFKDSIEGSGIGNLTASDAGINYSRVVALKGGISVRNLLEQVNMLVAVGNMLTVNKES